MGKKKYSENVMSLFRKSPVVKFSSIERIVKDKKNVKQYTKQLVRNMLLKGNIKKLSGGFYTIHDDISLIVFCFNQSYLGLQDALSFHGLWEQETIPVIITASKARQGIRKVLGMNVLIRRIDKKYFFGFEYMNQGELYLPYSDLEKTFIDMIYFKQKLNEETLKNIKKRIDKNKLNSYLKSYPKRFRKGVLRLLDS